MTREEELLREAENAVDRLLAHMGDVRHYLSVYSKPWIVKEMATILAETKSAAFDLGSPSTSQTTPTSSEPQTAASEAINGGGLDLEAQRNWNDPNAWRWKTIV